MIGLQFLFRHRRLLGKAVAWNAGRDRHLFGARQRAQPVGRVCGAHRRKDAVEENLAQEQDLAARQIDGEIASGVGSAKEQDLDFFAAERERLPVVDELGAGRQPPARYPAPTRGLAVENSLRRRMNEVTHARRKRRVAAGVIAVVGTDHHVCDRPRRDASDRVDQAFRGCGIALAVGDEHGGVGDDEHAGGGEFLVAGVEVLVGIDVVRDLDRAREVLELEAALDGVGGPDDLRRGGERCQGEGQK